MAMADITKVSSLQAALLSWFSQHGRTFPWREQSDPFAVLLAEKLLQQTAARPAVVDAYIRLLEYYPSPEALAAAGIKHLEELVKPLGFFYRAHELAELGRVLVERHGGQVPKTLKELLALPGVGDYTARAVLSFAYGYDVPVVDTNVARWLYRLDGLTSPLPNNPARKKSLLVRAGELVPAGRAKDWNYAVLDLCALVCKTIRPLCEQCPLQPWCTTGQGLSSVSNNEV